MFVNIRQIISALLTCTFVQVHSKYRSRAPPDVPSGEEAIQGQALVGEGEAIQSRERLNAESPIPHPNQSKRGALSSGVQTRRRKAASEATDADRGERAPEKKKRQRRSQAPMVPGE